MSRGLDRDIDDLRDRPSSWDHRGEERDSRDREPERIHIRRLDRDRIPVDRELPEYDARDRVRVQDEIYRLRQTEIETLQEVGRFRVVDEQDLQRFHYADDSTRMREDLRSLREQGLIERHSLRTGNGIRLKLVSLTDRGKQVAEEFSDSNHSKRYYSGFVKPNEAEHDAALYRMYQAEAARIHAEGGTVWHVELDFETKRKVYTELGKAGRLPEDEYRELQQRVAERHRLRVVRGHIQIPDLRIQYSDEQGKLDRVSLELTTEHYSKGQLAAKAAAGFRLYSLGGNSSSGGSSVRDEHEITADILSL